MLFQSLAVCVYEVTRAAFGLVWSASLPRSVVVVQGPSECDAPGSVQQKAGFFATNRVLVVIR